MNETCSDEKADTLAGDLIRTQRIMIVATVSKGKVWTAPVYYYFHGTRFYFFSNSGSRHIIQSKEQGEPAGASIFSDSPFIEKIRGLQMSGIILKIHNPIEAVKTAKAYIKKFAIDFTGHDALTYLMKQFKADLYAFVPHEIHYMDNRVRFGFRTRIYL